MGTPFRLHPSMQAITLEVILRAVFGITDERRRDELSGALVEILGATASPRAVGFIVPGLRRTPMYRRLDGLSTRIDELLAAEITERRADPDLSERDDILSMLVEARFDDGSRMEDAELRDQLMTLLLAGHETTATALAWTFDLLFRMPDAFARLTEEVRAGELEYLDAVIEESLRVRPVVPFTGRELREPAGARRLRAGRRHDRDGGDLAHPYSPRPLSGAVRLPAGAVPRGRDRDVLMDPVRRRHPALHRRRLRPVRDAGRAGDDPALVRAAAGIRPPRARRSDGT